MIRENKKYLFREMFLCSLLFLGNAVVIYLLLPQFFSLLIYLLKISINVFSCALISSAFLGIIIVFGLVTKSIEVETEYQFTDTERFVKNTDLSREQVVLINGRGTIENMKNDEQNNKFSYVFDNNYQDTEDEEIDDITYLGMEINFSENIGYKRKKVQYRGKYLR